ncbi:MAG: alpha/beta hydrolase [Cyclobacteriaceae bacterium]
MHIQNTTFSYQAPYYTTGKPEADQLWIVLHGYGQLAQYFIPKFEFLSDKALIVAPEGLSHFYLQGVSGRIGASWMTRQHRELAISNYIAYLDRVYDELIATCDKPFKKVTMLGFSQGVSTLIRWLCKRNPEFDQLLMCAGSFPEDVDKDNCSKVFRNKTCYYLYGDQDQYMQEGSIDRLKSLFDEYGLQVEILKFSGKHEIHQPSLELLA